MPVGCVRAARLLAIPAFIAVAATVALHPGVAQAAPLSVTVTGPQGQPLAGAAVSVVMKGAPVPTRTARVELAQRNRSFVPGMLVVQTGTAVHFPNFDTVRHHVYSFSPIKTFEIKLYAGTPAAPVVFDRPGTAVLGCNIHDQMSAFVHVVDTPHFGQTDAAGRIVLELPPGEHRLQVWHPMLGAEGAAQTQWVKLPAAGTAAAVALKPGDGT